MYYDCSTQADLFASIDDLTQVIDLRKCIHQFDVEVVMRLLDIARTAARKVRRGRRQGHHLPSATLGISLSGYCDACAVALAYGRKANTYLTMMVRMVGGLIKSHVSRNPQPFRSTRRNTMTTMTNSADMILIAFGSSPVRAAKLCLTQAEQSDSRSAKAYARLAIEHANTARVARRARARVYKSNDFTASDPAIEAVLGRAWHSAKHCIERSLDLMQ